MRHSRARLLRKGIEILIFLGLVTLTAVLTRPLQDSISRYMLRLRNELISSAEAYLGRSISYASMGPSIFGTLDIRDITIRDETGRTLLSVSRLRLDYSLGEILRGRFLNSPQSIHLDEPVLTLDIEKDKDILELFTPSPGGKKTGLEMLPENLVIRFRRGSVSVVWPGNRAALGGISFDASIRGGRALLSGRWNGNGTLSGGGRDVSLKMTGGISGEIAGDLKSGSVNLSIPSFSTEYFSLGSLTFNLAMAEEVFELRKVEDRLPFDLFFRFDMKTKEARGEFRADSFRFGDLVRLLGDWKTFEPWLGLQTGGFATFSGDSSGKMEYAVKLAGELPDASRLGNASFAIDGSGNESRVRFERFNLELPRGALSFSGGVGFKPLSVNGELSLSRVNLARDENQSGAVNGDFTFTTHAGEVSVYGENISFGSVLLSTLDAHVNPGENGLEFNVSLLRFRDLESYEDVSLSEVNLDGSFEFAGRHLEAQLSLDSFSLGDIAEMLRPFGGTPEISGAFSRPMENVLITTEVFLTTDFEQLSYNVPRFICAYGDVVFLSSISGTDRRFDLTEGSIVWANKRFETSAFADFSNPLDISFAFTSAYQELNYYFEGVFLDKNTLDIRGSYGLALNLSMAGKGSYSGLARVEGLPLPVNGQNARLYLESFLRWNSRDSWSAELARLELQDLLTPVSATARFFVQGTADESGARIPEIYFDDGRGAISGRANAAWESDFSNIRGVFTASDSGMNERYTASFNYLAPVLELELSGSRVQVDRFVKSTVNPLLSGNLNLTWRGDDDIEAAFWLSSLTARMGRGNLTLSAEASLDRNEFAVRDIKMRYGGLSADVPVFSILRENSSVYSRVMLEGNISEREIEMDMNLTAGFDPVDSWFEIDRILNSVKGNIELTTLRFDNMEAREPFLFVFERNNSRFALSGGPENLLRFDLDRDGFFYAGLAYPSPVRGLVAGSLKDGMIEASSSNLYADLTSLWRFIPRRDIIDFTGGFVDAKVRITGPIGDPEFFGRARGTSVRFLIPRYIRDEIGPVTTNITFDGNEMTLLPAWAGAGSGRGLVKGSFFFDRWVPDTFTMEIDVAPQNPLPYGFEIAGVRAQGYTSGHVSLVMTDGESLHISGPLAAYDTIVTANLASAAAEEEENRASKTMITTDLTVTAGRRFEFVWPSDDFPIIRTYADVGSAIKVTSDESTGRFSLTGNVTMRSGEVFYFQRSFYIREGSLNFNENELKFNPLLSARAEIRDRSEEGPVTISMIIENAPLLSFTPRFEANPPLSQVEIFSLLGQNIYDGGASSGDANAANGIPFIDATADLLTQFRGVRLFERRVRDFLSLDMFSIRTQVIQNAVLRITGIYSDPVDTSAQAGNYFDNTTVFLGKYFGQDIFVQSMLSARYDPDAMWGVRIEPYLGLELRGSLFNIQFNMLPEHPENMFVDDLSFTITRKWSF